MKFIKRLTVSKKGASLCSVNSCPDVWKLDSGDYAVIGEDITQTARPILPKEVVLGVKERIVLVPQNVFRAAKPNI